MHSMLFADHSPASFRCGHDKTLLLKIKQVKPDAYGEMYRRTLWVSDFYSLFPNDQTRGDSWQCAPDYHGEVELDVYTTRKEDCLLRREIASISGGITVIIPAYNASSHIRATIRSVVEQTRKMQVRIVILDDGSADDTVKEAVNELEKDSHVVAAVLVGLPRLGRVSAVRNFGIFNLAHDTYVAFMDSDDLYATEDSLFRLVLSLERNSTAFAAFGANDSVDEDGVLICGAHMLRDDDEGLHWKNEYNLTWEAVLKKNFSPLVQNLVIRRDSCPRFPYILRSEDLCFYGRLFAESANRFNGKLDGLLQVPEVTVHYRVASKSESNQALGKFADENLDAFQRAINLFLETLEHSKVSREYLSDQYRSTFASRYWVGRLAREIQNGRLAKAVKLYRRASRDSNILDTDLIRGALLKLKEDNRILPFMWERVRTALIGLRALR